VQVVSFGTGLEQPLCELDSHGSIVEKKGGDGGQEKAPAVGVGGGISGRNSGGLYAVVLEGTNAKRMMHLECNSGRQPLLYMAGYLEKEFEEEEGNLYDVPRNIFPQPSAIPRIDTWSARTVASPVHSNLKNPRNQYNVVRLATKRQKDHPRTIIEEDPPPVVPPKPLPKPPLPPRPGRASPGGGTGNSHFTTSRKAFNSDASKSNYLPVALMS